MDGVTFSVLLLNQTGALTGGQNSVSRPVISFHSRMSVFGQKRSFVLQPVPLLRHQDEGSLQPCLQV